MGMGNKPLFFNLKCVYHLLESALGVLHIFNSFDTSAALGTVMAPFYRWEMETQNVR